MKIWTALAEIYTMLSFAPFWNLISIVSFKIAEMFADFLQNVTKSPRILLNFADCLLNFN